MCMRICRKKTSLLQEWLGMLWYSVWKNLLQLLVREHSGCTALLTGEQMYFLLLLVWATQVGREGKFWNFLWRHRVQSQTVYTLAASYFHLIHLEDDVHNVCQKVTKTSTNYTAKPEIQIRHYLYHFLSETTSFVNKLHLLHSEPNQLPGHRRCPSWGPRLWYCVGISHFKWSLILLHKKCHVSHHSSQVFLQVTYTRSS
jgi:hypothetical protein